ncbi:DUF6491 family protein [Phenylobacterium sp. J426]|uniref:DUF6491 family protein n=1 Tax=Phenylobacterium sp. J426 TaxID=2898439 RepID=UPI0021507035|nr:DUF6491 family protein [Phenylobacterium sp. J426]MCR5874611.1 DUF6491 family protein [Phenylobacterium sp. J426]
MNAAAPILLVLVLGACSAYPPAEPAPVLPPPPAGASLSGADCFRTMDIRNHTVVNNQTLMVRVNRGEVYRVTMAGSCLAGSISSDPLIIRQPPGSAIVCKPIDLDIGIARGGVESRCIVESIVRASPAEVEALPRRLRP